MLLEAMTILPVVECDATYNSNNKIPNSPSICYKNRMELLELLCWGRRNFTISKREGVKCYKEGP